MHDFVEVKRTHKSRLIFVGVMSCFMVTMVILRLYVVQVKEHAKWKALGQKTVKYSVSKKRGTIFDRNLSKLAISSPVKSCYICPEEVLTNSEGVAMELSKRLGINKEKVLQSSLRKSKFVWIKRAVADETAEEIQKLNLPGVYFKNEFKRIYPYGGLASNLLGCVGQDGGGILDNKGLEGIEAIYNNYLKGVTGVIKKQFDSKAIAGAKSWDIDSRYFGGVSIHLTIDDIIQSIIEKELDQIYKFYKPKSTFIIVQNPLTGELLGIATRPGYDANNLKGTTAENRKNRALLDVYEPGSTFKIFTFAAALEAGAISESELFNCGGMIKIFGDQFVIKCHDLHGKQTYAEAFANSCNPVTIQIAMKLGRDKFYEFIKKAGFGSPTNILPNAGESGGILREPRRWSALSLPSMSMGQEIGVNGVQLISAASAVLNDGVMMKPLLVTALEDSNSKTIRKFEIEPFVKLFSRETAEKMKKSLKKVVTTGTGKRSAVEGYEILGKTGTSQKSGGRAYEAGKYFSSYLGFINEPHFKLSILVVINEPQLPAGAKDVHGGTVAAPAFKNVAEKILMYYNILPEEKKIETFVSANDLQKSVKIPDIVGLTASEAKVKYEDKIKIQFLGNGPLVVKQFPKPFKFLPYDESVIAYLGNNEDLNTNQKNEKNFFMPMLIGKSMKESLEILKNYNLSYEFSGSGFVAEQKPMPGELLSDNNTIKLNFSMNKN
ncbi:MAG: Stage V sporulation protein D [bacterium ADurb.Bin243]|nr:MAG: Stage V sporulation protein D [bacterium ADurb.Bin243]